VCTHLGCTVRAEALHSRDHAGGWSPAAYYAIRFACPCHGSKYTGDGRVVGRPAPRPLAWYHLSVSVDDGQLIVDLPGKSATNSACGSSRSNAMSKPRQGPHRSPERPGVHPTPFWSFKPRSDRGSGRRDRLQLCTHCSRPGLQAVRSIGVIPSGLGTISAALLLLLVSRACRFWFWYVPSVDTRYGSSRTSSGSYLRLPGSASVHRLSAHLMVRRCSCTSSGSCDRCVQERSGRTDSAASGTG